MKKFTLLIASLFITIGAMAQNTLVLGVNSVPETKVDLTNGLESGYYLLKQVNSAANAAGGYGVGWIKAASEASGATVTSKNTGTPSTDGVTYVWYVEVVDATNNLITISTANKIAAWQAPYQFQKNLVAYDSRATLKYHTGTVNLSGDATPNEGSCFISNEDATAYVHFSGDYLGSWNDTNSGSMFMVEFYKLEGTELNAIVTEELSYILTDMAGNKYSGTYEGIAGTTLPTITGAAGYTLTNEVWDGANYTATINFTYPVSNKEKGITNETLLSAWNNELASGKFVRGSGNNVKVQTIGVATIDANCLWAIYPSFDNGAFTFTIMNIATGKYLYSEAENNSSYVGNDNNDSHVEGIVTLNETPSTFVLADDGNDFKFSDKEYLYLSINSTNNTNVWLGVHKSAHGGTNIYDIALPQYEVAITEAKYATFFAPYAVEIPEGVTAHAVTINENWAVLSDPLEVIPAYTGVVLYSETAQTYTFNVTTTDVTVENNALTGTVAATYITADAYVLGYINEEGAEAEVGFGKAVTEGQAAGTFLNNHHKAYLPASAVPNASATFYGFDWEGTTGIDEMTEQRAESKEIYDLTGRRVENITAPGIYIVGGKKVLVK